VKKIECGIGELSYFREYHILCSRVGFHAPRGVR
jgi:hypothetical protein